MGFVRYFFFFSSRRRHTRCSRDWSSDVCSSDLMLDYRDLDSADEIASRPPVHITFTGRKTALDKSRKWTQWNVSANSGAVIERTDGTAQIFLGNAAANGKVYQLSDTQLSDDGAAIGSYYTTHFIPERQVEQQLQLGAHRKLFTYLAMYVEGAGSLALTAQIDNAATPVALQPLALSSPALKDLEQPIHVSCERVAFQVSTSASAPGSWFRLQKFVPSVRPDPWAPVRGGN